MNFSSPITISSGLSTVVLLGSRAFRFHLQSHVPLRISGASATEGLDVGGCLGCALGVLLGFVLVGGGTTQIFLEFSPRTLGMMIQFGLHIFQWGWLVQPPTSLVGDFLLFTLGKSLSNPYLGNMCLTFYHGKLKLPCFTTIWVTCVFQQPNKQI